MNINEMSITDVEALSDKLEELQRIRKEKTDPRRWETQVDGRSKLDNVICLVGNVFDRLHSFERPPLELARKQIREAIGELLELRYEEAKKWQR